MRKKIKKFSAVFSIFIIIIMSLIAYGDITIANQFIIPENTVLELGNLYKISQANKTQDFDSSKAESIEVLSKNDDESSSKINIKLMGLFPVKTSVIKDSERKQVVVSGEAFGLRIFSDGLIVVSVDSVDTAEGKISPGYMAGIKSGDIIKAVNGKEIRKIGEFTKIVENSKDKTLSINIMRNNKSLDLSLKPVKAEYDGKNKAGLWLRDSSAGIGTMTFYEAESGIFAGLGHGVCDADTGKLIPLYSGEALDAIIKGAYKGGKGSVGELSGVFGEKIIGSLDLNTNAGIYGILNKPNKKAKKLPVAMKQEIKQGSAQIISTIDESGPQIFDIEILKVNSGTENIERNMTIEIVDEKLIEVTGGIVQGMSGSPIIQNGHLVGAVTHVFLNNSLQGYGIFAENMLSNVEELKTKFDMKNAA